MYWMITNRKVGADSFGDDFSDLTFWQNAAGPVDDFTKWTKLTPAKFRQGLVDVTDKFPDPLATPSEEQQHLNIFVHGFDNTWISAAQRYGAIVDHLFSGAQSLGVCVLYLAVERIDRGLPAGSLRGAPIGKRFRGRAQLALRLDDAKADGGGQGSRGRVQSQDFGDRAQHGQLRGGECHERGLDAEESPAADEPDQPICHGGGGRRQ